MATNRNKEVPFTVVTPITPDADRARWRNEAAWQLRRWTDWVDADMSDLLDEALNTEHRATVERIRAEFSLRRDEQHTDQHEIDYDRYCMNCPDEGTVLNAILDAEAAR